jgi:hypothetical protein
MRNYNYLQRIKKSKVNNLYEKEYKYALKEIFSSEKKKMFNAVYHVAISKHNNEYYDLYDSCSYIIKKLRIDGYKVFFNIPNKIIVPLKQEKEKKKNTSLLNLLKMDNNTKIIFLNY